MVEDGQLEETEMVTEGRERRTKEEEDRLALFTPKHTHTKLNRTRTRTSRVGGGTRSRVRAYGGD